MRVLPSSLTKINSCFNWLNGIRLVFYSTGPSFVKLNISLIKIVNMTKSGTPIL